MSQKKKTSTKRRWWRRRPVRIIGSILTVLIVLGGLIGYFEVRPVMADVKAVQQQVIVLKAAAKAQDLGAISAGLPEMQNQLDRLQKQLSFFAFTQYIPFIGHYYTDSQHFFAAGKQGIDGGSILIKAITPYADVLGLKSGQNTTPTGATNTQDRIAQLVLLMPSILPSLDEANTHFEQVKKEMDAVDVAGYPGKIGGTDVRATLTGVKGQVDSLETGMQQARPLLEVLPSLLGAQQSKRYLIIFQNDKELRPTGGFMTSIAYVTFNQGKFEVSNTGDIYQLDNNKAYLPTPKPLITYLKAPKWYLRDTNFSPDFVTSMHDFETYYTKEGNPPIDGIIAVDTQLVEGLMELTGPLTVPGYSQPFSAQPVAIKGGSIPQVVYQLELISEKSGGGVDRKGVLGDLMQAIIQKLLSESPSNWPNYLKLFMTEGQQKHVLFYLHDDKGQQFVEQMNLAGRIKNTDVPEDYLHINDANLAGLKSNLYLKQQTKQQVTIDPDGTVHKKLTITYTNTGSFDGWLNANAHNYLRVYVPLGSKLTRATGGDQKVITSTDLGKTVFDNFVLVHPKESRTVTFEYTLPFKISGTYHELIQKQPGAQNWTYSTTVNENSSTLTLDGDKELNIKL